MSESFYIMHTQYVALDDKSAKKYLPYYGRAKTKAEWAACGIKFELDTYDIPIRTDLQKKPFFMIKLVAPSDDDILAIETGKRCVNGIPILDFLKVGIAFDEFIDQPQHVKDYCFGRLAEDRGELLEAKVYFLAAVVGQPAQVRYRECFYRLSLQVDGIGCIDDEVNFFSNDMDSMIHTGRVYEWLAALLACKKYTRAAELIILVDRLMSEAIEGKRNKTRYAGQSIGFISYKRDSFRKKIARWYGSSRYKFLIHELSKLGGIPLPDVKSS
jgi:hypothetical protein